MSDLLHIVVESGDPFTGLPRLRRVPRWTVRRALALGIVVLALTTSSLIVAALIDTLTPPAEPSLPDARAGAAAPFELIAFDSATPIPAPAVELVESPASPAAAIPVRSGMLGTLPPTDAAPAPVALFIPSLGVEAPIVAVGIAGDEMDIPRSARQVAWYEYGPSPGENGSAVLAAHVAWQRRPGVFKELASVALGDTIAVGLSDGSMRWFEITSVSGYDKDQLPAIDLFRRTGEPVVTLITCGGAFNPSLGSYEENVVVVASPIDQTLNPNRR